MLLRAAAVLPRRPAKRPLSGSAPLAQDHARPTWRPARRGRRLAGCHIALCAAELRRIIACARVDCVTRLRHVLSSARWDVHGFWLARFGSALRPVTSKFLCCPKQACAPKV
jgi:hypothetical protein